MSSKTRIAICAGFGSVIWRESLRGIVDYCVKGANWEISLQGATRANQEAFASAITQWKAKGAIVAFHSPFMAKVIAQAGIPAVEMGGEQYDFASTVSIDYSACGRLAAEHLLERGFASFGFCGDTPDRSSINLREAFTSEIRRHGHPCSELSVNMLSSNWVENHARVSDWLKQLPKPAGVMGGGDFVARGVIWACRDAGLRVPEDVAVIGNDNDPLESFLAGVPLSTIALPGRLVGRMAAQTLQHLISGKIRKRRVVLLKPVGVLSRQSTNAFGKADADIQMALRVIAEHADKPISVSNVLDNIPISRRRLERSFVEILKRSPGEEILRVHLERAQSLLAGTEMKVASVAQASGFTSYTLFCRHFHKRVGMTPGEYREKFRVTESDSIIGA
jgi:LacI family transcriptional regulator